jgi:hypothetical protein
MIKGIGSRIAWGSLLLVAVSAASCKFESAAVPTTQLVVDIDAEPGVRSKLDELRVLVASARHRDNLEEREPTFEESLRPGSDPEAPVWPVRIVLTPKSGDARRVFELSATAVDAAGEQVAQARVITGYVSHQIHYVKVVIEDDCIGISCDELDTCKVGGCTPAFVEPRDLPLLPGLDADAAVDAGDGAPPPDAAPEAGLDGGGMDGAIDSGMDTGPAEDPCTRVDHGGCDPLVVCQTIDGIPTCGQCPNGYVDVNGNGSRCEDIDECKLPDKGGCDTSHGQCTNTPGGHDCSCEAGYHGDGRDCTVNVPCSNDPTVCDVLATCQDIQGEKVCQCKLGYEGDGGRCTNIDECTRNLDDCPVHAACADTEGSFTCTCDAGYAKPVSGANQCNDIDECLANTDNCDDVPNACRNTDGGFMCQCPAGYSGTGVGDTCVDVNECTLNLDNCDANPDACVNDVGSFHCTCPPGYSGLGVGNTCSNINQCATDMDDCAAAPAVCVDDTGFPGFHCTCPVAIYTGAGTIADPCVDVNECVPPGVNNCNANATCANTAGSYTCTCGMGYMSAGSMPGRGVGGCVNINECTSGASDCNGNAMCTDTVGSFTCTCNAPGYVGAGATPGHGPGGCTEVDECTPPGMNDCNANATCANTPAGSFTCTCSSPGYVGAGAKPGHGPGGCTDVNECVPPGVNNCNANAACTNAPAGDYTCTCGAGFTAAGSPPGRGPTGCADTNGCTGSPCLNGGTCADIPAPGSGHTCMCPCGFSGASCETMATRSNVGAVTLPETTALDAQTAYAVQITLTADAKLVGLGIGNGSGLGTVSMALYADSGSSPAGARLAVVGPSAVSGTFPVAGCTVLSAGTYWVAVLSDQQLTVGQEMVNVVPRYKQAAATELGVSFGSATADPGAILALYAITIP